MLISQAVYVAFCKSFSDSFLRFDEHFKDGVVNVVHEWMTGMYNVVLIISPPGNDSFRGGLMFCWQLFCFPLA